MLKKIYSVGLRASGLAARFGLTVYLAKALTLDQLGLFSIFIAAVYMAPATFGFGLHYRVNRDFVGSSVESVASVLFDKLVLLLISSPIVFLFSYLLWFFFSSESINWVGVFLLFSVCLGEIVATDLCFALINIGNLSQANTLQFVRSASWIIPLVFAFEFFGALRSVNYVLIWWLFGQCAGLVMFFYFTKSWGWFKCFRNPRRFGYLLEDFRRVTLPVYLSDISIVAAGFGDRFIIGSIMDVRAVGIYTFFWSLANGVYQLLYVGLVQPALSKFVSAYQYKDWSTFLGIVNGEFRKALIVLAPTVPFAFASGFLLTELLGKRDFLDSISILAILMLGMSARTASDIYSYGLYAARRDRSLVLLNVASCLIALLTVGSLTFVLGMMGAAFGFMLAALLVFYLKRRALLNDATN